MKWLRKGLTVLFVLGALALTALAFRPKPLAVEVTTVVRGDLVEMVEEPGKTRVRERFVVSAPVSGDLARIEKKPGDPVQVGDVLATIRPLAPAMMDARTKNELEARLQGALAAQALASATVEKARAVKEFGDRELARLKELANQGAVAQRDLEKAELDLKVADKDVKTAALAAHVAAHEVDVARAAVASTAPLTPGAGTKSETSWVVRSPLDGRVLRVLQPSAGVVAAGTPLVEVADPGDLEVVVGVLTSDAVRVASGAHARLERWGGAGVLEGRVRSVEPSGYTKLSALGVEEQRVDVVIDIVSPAEMWSALGDGFRVFSQITVHREPDTLKTSAAALFRDGDGWALFVVQDDHVAKRKVQVERRNGAEVALTGVEAGTTVVNFPSKELRDGAAVSTP